MCVCVRVGGGGGGVFRDCFTCLFYFSAGSVLPCPLRGMGDDVIDTEAPSLLPPLPPTPLPHPLQICGRFLWQKGRDLAGTHARTHERAVDLQKGVYYDKSMDIYM